MKNLSLLEKLYLIPLLGLVIAIIWCICDINYVESNKMRAHIMFYGGMICHILVSQIIIIILAIHYA